MILQVLPKPLDGIELQAMGRLKEQHDIVRKLELLSGMKAPVIQLDHMELMGIVLGQLLQIELKAGTVAMGKLQQKALSRHRLYSSIEVKRFKAPLHWSHRFSAGQCDPPPRKGLIPSCNSWSKKDIRGSIELLVGRSTGWGESQKRLPTCRLRGLMSGSNAPPKRGGGGAGR